MPAIRNAKAILCSYPEGYLTSDDTIQYVDTDPIDVENAALSGGFLVKTIAVSLHLYNRDMMRPAGANTGLPTYPLGDPISTHGVGVVIRSESNEVKVGDHVYGFLSHQEYSVIPSLKWLRIIDNIDGKVPWSYFLGTAGMPGQTAYYGWREFAKAKKVVEFKSNLYSLTVTVIKGDTVFVTTGAGAVGSLVIQIAKAEGLKVIACAGTDEKVEYMKSIGADVPFNYKTTNVKEVLAREGPIDIYWDNVGGKMLEAALDAAKTGARFIESGMVSGYGGEVQPVTNLMNIITKHISMFGLVYVYLEEKWGDDFYATVPQKLATGEFKASEEEHVGLEKVSSAMQRLLEGRNHGTVIIKVADD